jgi:putative ABC transport system permease protein
VIVLNRFLAKDTGVQIGDMVEIEMATGIHHFEVIGLDSGFGEWGRTAFAPLDTLQECLVLSDVVSGFGVVTTTGNHDQIDRVSTEIEDTLLDHGYVVNNHILYLEWEEARQFNMNIINVMIAVGVLVMLITLIGLMSTLTMNVIERTKEIGMLRCLGSSSRSIWSIFGIEGVILSLVGWMVGMPLGYLVGRFLNYMSLKLMNSDFDLEFPVEILFIAGLITMVLTMIVIQPPLFRAIHLKPGDALRYE